MDNTKKLALLGFLPDIELRLKNLIQKNLTLKVQWVSATDPSLEGVVINSDFLATALIQKYVQQTKASVVCCYRDTEGLTQAQQRQVVSLDLRSYTPEDLQQWLSQLCELPIDVTQLKVAKILPTKAPTAAAKSTPASKKPVTSHASKSTVGDSNNSDSGHSAAEKPRQPSQTPVQTVHSTPPKSRSTSAVSDSSSANTPTSRIQTEQAVLSRNYETLIEQIASGTGYYFVRDGNKETWLDLKTQKAYLNHSRDTISGLDDCTWAEITSLPPTTHQARALPLKLWLFETIWQSDIDCRDEISSEASYKLESWPRPLSSRGRTEALRISAFIQSTPQSASNLKEKTKILEKTILRFLYAATLAGQVHITTDSEQRKFLKKTNSAKKPDKAKLSLLGKLRKKLGLSL